MRSKWRLLRDGWLRQRFVSFANDSCNLCRSRALYLVCVGNRKIVIISRPFVMDAETIYCNYCQCFEEFVCSEKMFNRPSLLVQ